MGGIGHFGWGKSRIPLVNDQFSLSAVAAIFIMMTAGVSGRTGKALGGFVKASLDANPKLLEAMAEGQQNVSNEIVSTEVVEAKDLKLNARQKLAFGRAKSCSANL